MSAAATSAATSNGVNSVEKQNGEGVDYLKELEETVKRLQNATNFNRVASKIRAVSANPKSIVVEMEVDESHVNGKGTLHGGQTASLLDIITARAVGVTVRDTPMVSLELSCSYLLPAQVGETILIEGIVLKIGRNIAFTECEFRRKSDNTMIAKGKHTLALLNHMKPKEGEKLEQF